MRRRGKNTLISGHKNKSLLFYPCFAMKRIRSRMCGICAILFLCITKSHSRLFDIHAILAKDIQNYIRSEERRLISMQHVLDSEFKFQNFHPKYNFENEELMQDPLSNYGLLNRLTLGLQKIMNYTETSEVNKLSKFSTMTIVYYLMLQDFLSLNA